MRLFWKQFISIVGIVAFGIVAFGTIILQVNIGVRRKRTDLMGSDPIK